MRRNIYKIYIRIRKYLDLFLNMSIIHCSKVALFALFFVSTTTNNYEGATLFNALLFVIFLGLSTINYNNVLRWWRFTILVVAGIILSMYIFDVFKIPGNNLLFEFIGVKL